MHAQVGDFWVSRWSPTVLLMRILRNTGFFKSQNLRQTGTLCNQFSRLRAWTLIEEISYPPITILRHWFSIRFVTQCLKYRKILELKNQLASVIDTSLYYMLMYFPANSLVDREIGATSEPCCIRDPIVNQKLFAKLNWFSNSSGSSIQG